MNRIFRFAIALGWMATSASALASPAGSSAPSSFGIRPDGRLDQEAIARAYKESEWEAIVTALQGYLREERGGDLPVTDRIFAFKYLGVILSADSASSAKAESYFTRLLELSPTVEIVDLIPSNRVADFFAKVKADFQKRKRYTQKYDVYGYATESGPSQTPRRAFAGLDQDKKSPPPHKPPSIQKKDNGWVWWTVGLTAAVGAGVGVYYLANQTPDKKINNNVVDPP